MDADLRRTSVQPDVLETLSKTRLPVTPQRLAILRVLRDSSDHPSAEMIYKEVVGEFPRISLKTVYSNLERFETVGLAHKVITMHGTSRYEVDAGHHAHFICNKCRSIEHDLPGESSLSAVGKVKRADFMISSVAVHFFGLCKECRQTKVVELDFLRKHLRERRWPELCRREPE